MSETTEQAETKTDEETREKQESIGAKLAVDIEAKCSVYECLRDPADQAIIKGFAYSMTNLARAATEKQCGVIVHGGGLDVDYAETEEQMNGYAVKRENGYSALYHEPKTLTL